MVLYDRFVDVCIDGTLCPHMMSDALEISLNSESIQLSTIQEQLHTKK